MRKIMKKKVYKKSKAIFKIIDKMFNQLNDCDNLGHEAFLVAESCDSLPVEVKDLVARSQEVLDKISYILTEDDFIWLVDIEDFIEDNKPANDK